jgi:hypothetical protein
LSCRRPAWSCGWPSTASIPSRLHRLRYQCPNATTNTTDALPMRVVATRRVMRRGDPHHDDADDDDSRTDRRGRTSCNCAFRVAYLHWLTH